MYHLKTKRRVPFSSRALRKVKGFSMDSLKCPNPVTKSRWLRLKRQIISRLPVSRLSGLTAYGLRDMLSEIMRKEVRRLKTRDYMSGVADSLLEHHEAKLSLKEVEREEKECNRIDKLLEVKILKSSFISGDECHGRFRALKKLEPKQKDVVARCPSPSPIVATGMIDEDSRYHSSVFLDPSIDLDSLKKGPKQKGETSDDSIQVSKYKDPILQKMSEQTSALPLYELAEQVVYRTSEGCKGILSSGKS